MYECKICGEEFETFQGKANHVRWKHLKYYCKNNETRKKACEKFRKSNEKRFGKWIEKNIICSKKDCNNKVYIKYREGKKKEKYFCSRSCANTRYHTEFTKKKCSESIKKAWKNGVYDNIIFNKRFSSKREREIVSFFKKKYPSNKWKSGGCMLYKEERISRDLYSDKLKICFEYDGIWHFKDIHGQLKRKQMIDKLLEEWCIEKNYKLVRIDEQENLNFNEIEKLFFENKKSIIKIGKRY